VSWTMKFPSGVLATGSSTYGAQMSGYFKVFGSKGILEMGPVYDYSGVRLRANYEGNSASAPRIVIDETSQEQDPSQFTREAEHFSECVLKNQTPTSPGEEGLRDMQYIQAIYGAAGVNM
jgi:predicted dehydrogenase